ncbi:hypothetical protein RB653_006132 [Dictyostelium firmibasis]|uniref:Zinc/iron permease n=1 Tax=Dictyostelium firmibasis TaxID=79012 RepID=A0AAN7UDY0_9MYCE
MTSKETFNNLSDCQNEYDILFNKYYDLLNSDVQDECSRESMIEYSKPIHIGAIFIILVCSALGTVLPILATHIRKLNIPKYSIIFGKSIGIGVILACALIHMLQPSVESLSSSCLPDSFTEGYGAYPFLFALLAAIVMQFLDFLFLTYITIKHNKKQSLIKIDSNENLSTSNTAVVVITPNGGNDTKSVCGGSGGDGHVHGGSLLMDIKSLKTIEAYLLEFGITMHSIFIGLTVGVVDDSSLKALLVALSFHQFFEGVALGSRISDAKLSSHWHEALLTLIFSISAPIGIGIGIGVVSSINVNGESFLFVQGIFDAICSGILLYIGFNLMLKDFPDDLNKLCNGKKYQYLLKIGLFFAIWLGAGLMSFIGKYL